MERFLGIKYKCLLLIFLVFLIKPAIVFAAADGEFTHVSGSVNVLRPSPPAIPAKVSDPVYVGDSVRAKSKSRAEITFTNGNIIKVAPGTKIDIKEYMFDEAKSSSVLKLSRGKIQAIIPENIARRISNLGEANRFEIHTPTAIAGARGTNFVVSYFSGITSVLVIEGIVHTLNIKFPEIVVPVTPGRITLIPDDKPPQPTRPATDSEMNMQQVLLETPPGEGAATETPAAPSSIITETPSKITEIPSSPPITETISDITPPTDTIPPNLTLPSKPPEIDMESFATFEFTSDEPSTFSFIVDGVAYPAETGTTVTVVLGPFSEGAHTIEVTATDVLGNTSSPVIYSWTTDYTGPSVTITPDASPAAGALINVDIILSSNEPSACEYSLDDGPWIATGTSITLEGLSEGSHTLEVQATDAAGNTSLYSLPFDLSRYGISGSVSGTGSSFSGTAEGNIAGVLTQNCGGYSISMSGSYSDSAGSSWHIVTGGESFDGVGAFNGYWISEASGGYSGTSMFGTSIITHLTDNTLGTGSGSTEGTYGGGEWNITDIGAYTEIPLVFGAGVSGSFTYVYWDEDEYYSWEDGMLEGLMGGTGSLWEGSSFLSLGVYDNPYDLTLWGMNIGMDESGGFTSEGGTIIGTIGGICLNDTLEGRAVGIYINPNGTPDEYDTGYIFSDDVSGYLYPGIDMYELGGNLTAVSMGTTTVLPSELYDSLYYREFSGIIVDAEGIDINGICSGETIRLQTVEEIAPWGIWWLAGGGTYSELSAIWKASINADDPEGIHRLEVNGSTTGDKLSGTITGYWADLNATTGIYVGETLGTFNPADYTWQAVAMGVSIETTKFLQMAADEAGRQKLQQLNIPCVEVGRTDLSGALVANGDYISLLLSDVIFFAPSTGDTPSIWATDEITGTYSFAVPGQLDGIYITDPINQFTISDGNSISADFQFVYWDNGGWIGTITNGAGTLSRVDVPGTVDINFHGAGAGTYTGTTTGSISGTAAGVAR